MKKLVVAVLLLTMCTTFAQAQKLTDEEVIEYIVTAREKGTTDQDIAKDLLRKGVSMDQVNRIKRKYAQQQKTGQGSTITEKTRMRTAPESKGRVSLESDKKLVNTMTQDEKEMELMGGLDFMFPDSLSMLVQEEMEKRQRQIFGHNIFQLVIVPHIADGTVDGIV